MLRIYEMYRLTKYVDHENDKHINDFIKEANPSSHLGSITARRAMKGVAREHIYLVKEFGEKRALKALHAALYHKYVHQNDDKTLIVTPEKGMHFIDGIPIFRVGLWNAWYKEYGGLVTFLTSGLIAAAFLFLARYIWHLIP